MRPLRNSTFSITDPLGHDGRVAARDLEHFVGHINPDDLARGADDLRGDEANLAGAAAEIEDGLASPQIFARIAATVIPLDHLRGMTLRYSGVVIDWAAKF